MNFEDITRLANLVKSSGLSEIEIEEDGVRLRISNGEVRPLGQSVSAVPNQPMQTQHYVVATPTEAIGDSGTDKKPEGGNFSFIKSPMVGTFYAAPSPDTPNFVDLNSEINPNTVVCIIEAMKVMNEIQGDMTGTIVEILVKNGQTVEYGQPLFKVQKS